MARNFCPIWIMFFYVFLCNIIKVNHFLNRLIKLLPLILSFLLTFPVPYAHVCIESIDFILLSSFELKAILLISSVKTLYLSLLIFFCVFNFDLLFLMNSSWFFKTIYSNSIFSENLFYCQVELLLKYFYNSQI